MTKEQAEHLAALDPTYRARKLRNGEWCVWCDASDHVVEFDLPKRRHCSTCASAMQR